VANYFTGGDFDVEWDELGSIGSQRKQGKIDQPTKVILYKLAVIK